MTTETDPHSSKAIIPEKWRSVVLIPILCLLGAAAGYLLPAGWHDELVAHSALGVGLVLIIGIVFSAFQVVRQAGLQNRLRADLPILALSALLVLVYSLVDHRSEKVILDELILQTSALQLTESNEYRVPQFSHNLQSEFMMRLGVPDKRPPLFPVILSMVHRLLDYDRGNGFLLNAFLGFWLFFALGKAGQFFDSRYGGYLMMLAMASLPLVSQNITSQHLEILYLTQIAFLFWISLRVSVHKWPDGIPLAYLLAAAIALTRYEGLIFFIVPFLLHLQAVQEERPVAGLKRVFILCPLTTAFIFALLGHVFSYVEFWQLDDMNHSSAFGLSYWGPNMSAFLDLLFKADRSLPGSLALSMAGLASVPVSLYHILKNSRAEGEGDRSAFPVSVFLLCAVIFLVLIFSYHWGHVNSHVTARFALFPLLVLSASFLFSLRKAPFWLLATAAVLTLLAGVRAMQGTESPPGISWVLVLGVFSIGTLVVLQKPDQGRLLPSIVIFWILYLLVETLPTIQQRQYEAGYIPMERVKVFFDWIDERAGTNAVFIAESSLYGILSKESSTAIIRFEQDPDILLGLKSRNLFTDIFVLQEVRMDGSADGEVYGKWLIPKGLDYETVEFHRITDGFGVRMIRVLGWQAEADLTPSAEPPASAGPES